MKTGIRIPHLKSIQSKMMATIILLIVSPLIFIAYYSFKTSENIIQQKISRSNSQALAQLGSRIEGVMEDMIKASNDICLDKQVITILSSGNNGNLKEQYYNTIQLDEQMTRAQNTILLYYNSYFTIFDFRGNIYSTYPRRNEVTYQGYRQSQWFRQVVDLDGYLLWIAPQNDLMISGDVPVDHLITLARLIKGHRAHGGYGILAISIEEAEFYQKFLKPSASEPGTELFIIDRTGRIISHSNRDRVGKNFKPIEYKPFITKVKNDFITVIDGRKKFISYTTLNLTGWTLVKLSSYDLLFKELIAKQNKNLIMLMMTVIAFTMVTVTIIIRITRPIKELSRLMQTVEAGNLDVAFAVSGDDEIAGLGKSFNKMLLRIKELINNIQEKQRREEQLRLEVLQAQINPHFLFNTLNTIRWTAVINQAQNVANLVGDLGRILEMSFKEVNQLITLKDELENLKSYLNLQKARYNQRFKAVIQLDAAIRSYQVPKLILQPLVENSLIHGLDQEREGILNIKVIGGMVDERILLEVRDDGKGIPEGRLAEILEERPADSNHGRFSGIGLVNVNQRIKLLFGDDYGLKITSQTGAGTLVQVWLPVVKEEDGHCGQNPDCRR